MKASERRTSPRKGCKVPLRFRVLADEEREESGPGRSARATQKATAVKSVAVAEGSALNLSERGIYFTSPEEITVGQALEIFFTLPSELTGRGAEQVRCRAHVVHVDYGGNTRGIGASVEAFEPVTAVRNWSN